MITTSGQRSWSCNTRQDYNKMEDILKDSTKFRILVSVD